MTQDEITRLQGENASLKIILSTLSRNYAYLLNLYLALKDRAIHNNVPISNTEGLTPADVKMLNDMGIKYE